jgi:hypothetical protein
MEFLQESNTMLTFKWNAVLKNGKTIPQFNGDGTENSFRLVQEQDSIRELKRLEIVCEEDGNAHLAVDLETGELEVRGKSWHPYNSLSICDVRYRVIFFRRKRGHLGTTMQQIGKPWIYRYGIGWQCTHNGKNYQRIMFYDPETAGIEIRAKR